jgi:hypothetical protein
MLRNGHQDLHHIKTAVDNSAITAPHERMSDQNSIDVVEWKESQSDLGAFRLGGV